MTQSSTEALRRIRDGYRSPAALAGLEPDAPLLLGLSGGADSRLLLHLLAKECKENGALMHLCHVHHGIRAEEADRDEHFCRALATEYGLPLHVVHANVPAMAQRSGESLEAVARQLRYSSFADIMQQEGIPLLVTAHNANDQLETMLLHLVRGCSLGGLGGISPARSFEAVSGAMLVRPLLSCSKADILSACEELKLSFVTDSTNEDTAYARNLLRAQVIPTLSSLHAHPEQQALRTAESLREDEQLLATLAQELLVSASRDDALDRATLAKAHPSLAKRALRLWVSSLGNTSLEGCHLDALLALCHPGATSKEASLPGGAVRAERDCLRFLSSPPEASRPCTFDLPLALGHQSRGDLGFRITAKANCDDGHQTVTQNKKNVYKPFIRDILTFDTIVECDTWLEQSRLTLRPRREGDTLLLRGVNRKLRKLQNEVGLPTILRNRLPLLCDGDTVLWAPFVGARDGAFAPLSKDTRHALSIEIEILPDRANDTMEEPK